MNRWYFWVLAPVMLASAVTIPLAADPPSLGGHVLAYAISVTLLLATLGLANPRRFHWAFRGVAAAIVAAGLAYFVSEVIDWRAGKPMGVLGRRSNSSLWNATLFLLVFALPALRFLLSGYSNSVADVMAVPETTIDSPGKTLDNES
jgi:hypothetical protein